MRKTLIKGDDKWEFSCDADGNVEAKGLTNSAYALYHNRDSLTARDERVTQAHTAHVQAVNGEQDTALFKTASDAFGCLLVLCSSSSGNNNVTQVSGYVVSVCIVLFTSHVQVYYYMYARICTSQLNVHYYATRGINAVHQCF